MADGYGYRRRPIEGGDGDLQEEDVWAVLSYDRDEEFVAGGGTGRGGRNAGGGISTPNPTSGRRPSGSSGTSRMMIPRSSSSSSYGQLPSGRASRQSAPVNIPDWSKIYKSSASATADDGTHYCRSVRDDSRFVGASGYGAAGRAPEIDDGDGEDEDGVVPPHEWLAKKVARSQVSSFSMFEGVGRTLKGRDLRMVRNAVLTKTGFMAD